MNFFSRNIDLSEVYVSADETHHLFRGRPLYDYRFLKVMSFHQPGVAAVADQFGSFHINLAGEPIYDKRFRKVFGYYQGLAAVSNDEQYFHVNLQGEPAYKARFVWVGNFQEDRAPVCDSEDNYYHITTRGIRAYAESYKYVGDFKGGIAVVYDHEGYAWHVDKKGVPLRDRKYQLLWPFHKGYAVAKDDKGFFHVDKRGLAIYSARYEWVEPYYNGLSLVQEHCGRLGTIDEEGRWVHTVRDSEGRSSGALVEKVMGDLVGFWKIQTIYAASKLGVFEQLHELSGLPLVGLARSVGVRPESLERLLHALLVMGYLRMNKDLYELSDLGMTLFTELRHAPFLWGEEQYLAFSGLWWSVKEDKSYFQKLYCKSFFNYLRENPSKLRNYELAIQEYAMRDYSRIPDIIDFSIHRVVMDVGGGTGILLQHILQKCGNVRGILLETDNVIDMVRELNKQVPAKLKLVKGDFFRRIPNGADAVLLCRVLHDWDEDSARLILSKVYDALPESGMLYVVEIIKPREPTADVGVSLDLNMLCITGGRERTLEQFDQCLASVGFIITSIAHVSFLSVIIARKIVNKGRNVEQPTD